MTFTSVSGISNYIECLGHKIFVIRTIEDLVHLVNLNNIESVKEMISDRLRKISRNKVENINYLTYSYMLWIDLEDVIESNINKLNITLFDLENEQKVPLIYDMDKFIQNGSMVYRINTIKDLSYLINYENCDRFISDLFNYLHLISCIKDMDNNGSVWTYFEWIDDGDNFVYITDYSDGRCTDEIREHIYELGGILETEEMEDVDTVWIGK